MALIVDQQSNFKHFCKICKKGFGCGRALGGHMRAHGIGDESVHIDDEDPASDWEDKLGGNVPASNKRMYALRTNPNRLKSCRVCENCGKEFLSWKSFLEHGKCTSEDAESLVSSPGSDGDDGNGRRGCGWSKRKRSMRAKVGNFNNSNCPSSEEEDLANCLMMLSNANVDNMVVEAEESCASASKEEERRNTPMNFIPPISYKVPLDDNDDILDINIINENNNNNNNNKNKGVAKGLFECKACKKVFNSHQALGGHRASHKKVKGCYAARLDHIEDSLADDDVISHEEFFPTKSNSTFQQLDHQGSNTPLASTSKRKSKVHECSICHRVFSSGQALGGHKRCHWITSNGPDSSALSKFHQFPDQLEPIIQKPKFDNSSELLDLKLDLNLPAPVDDVTGVRHDQIMNPTSFGVSTDIFLQSWIAAKENEDNNHHHHHHHHLQNVDIDNNDNNSIIIINNSSNNNNNNNNINNNNNNNNNSSCSMQNVEDEADSKVKLAKLSELKDMNMSGGSSPWLQVGIGSTTDDVAANP